MSKVRLVTLSPDAGNEEIFSIVERDGGVIVKSVLAPETVAALRRELDPIADSWVPGSRSGDPNVELAFGRNTKRFCGLCAKSKAFVDAMCHPTLLAYADHFLLPSCGSYWLDTGQTMIIGPGEPAQYIHRDQDLWPYLSLSGPELLVSTMFALGEFTTENGATQVVPGSHRWKDPDRQPRSQEIAQAVMDKGSVLFYTGKVFHGGGQNRTSDQWRFGMHISYALGWLRPEENHYLAVPLDIAKSLPPRAQQLLGYTAYYPAGYGGRLGLVDFEEPAISQEAAQLAKRSLNWDRPAVWSALRPRSATIRSRRTGAASTAARPSASK